MQSHIISFGVALKHNLGVWGKIGSYDTQYGIPCAKTRRLRYYMQKLIMGHIGAKLVDLGEF